MEINIYTDGASKGNPGPAGYGWVSIINDTKYYKSGGVKYATNNQMELRAVKSALAHTFSQILNYKSIKSNLKKINIYSDSQYVCNAFNKGWIFKWSEENFSKIKNPSLWRDVSNLLGEILKSGDIIYDFIWVKGHSGNKYNEEADSLAQMGCGHEGLVMQGQIKI